MLIFTFASTMKTHNPTRHLFLAFLLFAFASDSCNKSNDHTPPANVSYRVITAFPKLSFTRPVDLQHAGDQTNRLFVVEQAGLISVFPNDSTVPAMTIFLDIRSQVQDQGNEQRLLWLAFHPDSQTHGSF